MLDTCEELFLCMAGIETEEEFLQSVVVRRAVCMCLLDLGELVKNIGEDSLSEYPSEHWGRLIGFRNRAAHGYHLMDFTMVYSIVINRVPFIYEMLKSKQTDLEDKPPL